MLAPSVVSIKSDHSREFLTLPGLIRFAYCVENGELPCSMTHKVDTASISR